MSESAHLEPRPKIERESVHRHEALFMYGETPYCGACNTRQPVTPDITTCDQEDCTVQWKYLVVNSNSTANSLDYRHLITIDQSSVKPKEFMTRDETPIHAKSLGKTTVTITLNEYGRKILGEPRSF